VLGDALVEDRPGIEAEVRLDEHRERQAEQHEARQQTGRALERAIPGAGQEYRLSKRSA
jgi:hypothetical protein